MSETSYRGFLMTLDPLHIGSGGYRLSRVDLPIVREPGTNLPKIPGTSLSGAARAYAALQKGGNGKMECAGQRKHCGKCPVCVAFGSMLKRKDEKDLAYSGMVNLFDARLLFFPTFSMAGPLWTTSVSLFTEAGFELAGGFKQEDTALMTRDWPMGRINLGWILLSSSRATVTKVPPAAEGKEWEGIKDRLVILPDALFSQIVNSNLEVRTSVSIDPETGAAEEGALFTYEAIPRSAWLHLELIEHRYRDFPSNEKWQTPLQVVWDGLRMAEKLGIGGMGTRGFGRIRLLGQRPGGDA